MAQVVSQPSNIEMTYVPPPLPTFLADTHPLKPIIGVPVDEEMEAIHATIRAMNGVSHLPTLYDLNISIRLAQHLFDAQMAVYRSKYPFSIFPADIRYTPPSLPSFITETLEPVVGPPSDEQLESVYSAVRAMDGLTNFPSMLDPELSMKLSQHLFDIQLARHIQHSSQGQFTIQPAQKNPEPPEARTTLDTTAAGATTFDVRSGAGDEVGSAGSKQQSSDTQVGEAHFDRPSTHHQESNSSGFLMKGGENALEATNNLLIEIGDALKNITQVLILSQNSTVWSTEKNAYPRTSLNKKGELPSKYSLPRLFQKWNPNGYSYFQASSGGNLTDQQLASYLKFYDIGIDLIEDGETPTIKAEKKREAEELLFKCVWEGSGLS